MYGYGYNGAASWVGMGLMMSFGLLVLVGVVLLIVWLARGSHESGQAPPPNASQRYASATGEACDVAKLRYARGEITKEQFEEICRTVGG